jgi:hypothetical protein
MCTTLHDKVCQWLATDRSFESGIQHHQTNITTTDQKENILWTKQKDVNKPSSLNVEVLLS